MVASEDAEKERNKGRRDKAVKTVAPFVALILVIAALALVLTWKWKAEKRWVENTAPAVAEMNQILVKQLKGVKAQLLKLQEMRSQLWATEPGTPEYEELNARIRELENLIGTEWPGFKDQQRSVEGGDAVILDVAALDWINRKLESLGAL